MLILHQRLDHSWKPYQKFRDGVIQILEIGN